MDIRKCEIDALCFRGEEDLKIVAILDNPNESESSEDRVTVVYEEDGVHETITVGIDGLLSGGSREWDMDVVLKADKEPVEAKEETEEDDENKDCLFCHFCGCCECEVAWLIVDSCGPNICNDCVEHCANLINKKNFSSNTIPFASEE
jgi:hypothetical protein